MIRYVVSANYSLLATLITQWTSCPRGCEFWTQPDQPIQAGRFRHPQGYKIKAHRHIGTTSIVPSTTEVIIIEAGHLRATIYDQSGKEVDVIDLRPTDVLILWQGGHSFEALMETEAVEIRQGPYRGREQDKQELELPDATV